MARTKKDPSAAPEPLDNRASVDAIPLAPDAAPPATASDAGASLYRDRSGPARTTGPSEGAANFASMMAAQADKEESFHG